jgi:hypothetical protein
LKLRYYDLMIQYALHEKEYLNICKYYREIYDTVQLKDKQRIPEVTMLPRFLHVAKAYFHLGLAKCCCLQHLSSA